MVFEDRVIVIQADNIYSGTCGEFDRITVSCELHCFVQSFFSVRTHDHRDLVANAVAEFLGDGLIHVDLIVTDRFRKVLDRVEKLEIAFCTDHDRGVIKISHFLAVRGFSRLKVIVTDNELGAPVIIHEFNFSDSFDVIKVFECFTFFGKACDYDICISFRTATEIHVRSGQNKEYESHGNCHNKESGDTYGCFLGSCLYTGKSGYRAVFLYEVLLKDLAARSKDKGISEEQRGDKKHDGKKYNGKTFHCLCQDHYESCDSECREHDRSCERLLCVFVVSILVVKDQVADRCSCSLKEFLDRAEALDNDCADDDSDPGDDGNISEIHFQFDIRTGVK